MRVIIVGVDDSATAGRAAGTAAALARSTGARLHVVCAYAKESVTEVEDGTDRWHLTASGIAAGTAERVAAELSSMTPDVVGTSVEGKPADALVEAAEQLEADLIVVGNRRVQGPGRMLGSIATAVAHHAPCDVYIAHTSYPIGHAPGPLSGSDDDEDDPEVPTVTSRTGRLLGLEAPTRAAHPDPGGTVKTRIPMRARAAAVLCAGALTVTGCASSDGSEDTSAPTDEAAEEVYVDGLVNVEEAGEPVQGGTLTVAEYSEARSLNPIQTYATGATGMNVMASIYDTLMRWDPSSEEWVPQLAESLETQDDGTTWTLSLREGVEFTDGTPLDADAVVASLEYYLAGYGFGGNVIQANLESMEATDDRTVTFAFTSPWATFPQMLSGGPGMIMAPAAYQDPEKFVPIGAGPFELESMAPGERTTVVANEDYHAGRPPLDSIEFVLIPTDDAKVESLENDEVDVAYLRQDDVVIDAVQAGVPGSMNAVSGVRILNLNAREGMPTADVRVRQAINLAIDAGTFLERADSSAELSDRNLMADFSTWDTDVEPAEQDLEAAKALLEEAKADGFDGKVRFLGQSDATSQAGAVAIKAMLEAAGFEVTLDLVNTIADQVQKIYVDGDFDIAVGSTSISDADPYSRLFVALHSTSPTNPGRYANPEMDELLAELKTASGPDEGLETMVEIEELFKQDVPYVSMSGGAFFEAWDEDVHGIQPTAETAVLFDEAWISRD